MSANGAACCGAAREPELSGHNVVGQEVQSNATASEPPRWLVGTGQWAHWLLQEDETIEPALAAARNQGGTRCCMSGRSMAREYEAIEPALAAARNQTALAAA